MNQQVIANKIVAVAFQRKLEEMVKSGFDLTDSYDKALYGIVIPHISQSLVSSQGSFIVSDIKGFKVTRKGRDKFHISGKVFVLTAPDYKEGTWKNYEFGLKGDKMKAKISSKSRLDMISDRIVASYSRPCSMFKANNGKWYLGLAESDDEDAELYYYGPFSSEDETVKYLDRKFSNPGGWSTDSRGTRPPPHPVRK